MNISVVVPVYHGENLVEELVSRLFKTLFKYKDSIEIILVEDNSPDNSWESIKKICELDTRVKGIKLSRNFGQHYAITAGLEACKGDWIVVMDCDLQDLPEEIPKLIKKAKQGYEIVFAQRKERNDNFLKKLSSKVFYSIFGYLTNTQQDSSIANFGIYQNKVITAVLSMNDKIKYFPTMVQWVGFNSTKIRVDHGIRKEGKSSYSFTKLLSLALNNVIAFSDKPLRLTAKLGLGISMFSILSGLIYLYKYLKGEIIVLGFTSIIITLTFLSGLIIFTLGIIGIYLGKTFEQVKQRPNYIIQKRVNL